MADVTSDSRDRHILVVSDDDHVRDEARFGMPADVAVALAIDSREAAKLLEQRPPALVVVDMQTGNAGGYALTRDIAQSPRLARTPVLILLERVQDVWLARNAGAAAYRVKPLGPGELARAVGALLAQA